MGESKKREVETKTEENSHPHFVKIIEYTEEPWRTDILLGQKGSDSHGHLTLSGAAPWYFRVENDVVIIRDGKIVKDTL